MKIYYDPKADAIDIILKDGEVDETRKIGREVYLDVDKKGEPLSLEILGASERLPVDEFNNLTFNVANYPSDFGRVHVAAGK
jgi:uncharacterized protein YuzE